LLINDSVIRASRMKTLVKSGEYCKASLIVKGWGADREDLRRPGVAQERIPTTQSRL